MLDIAPSELLLVAVVALLVIGPKDLPLALRTVGRWMGKVRRMSNHFRSGVETMIREAELAEIEKEWQERNARIMAEHPDAEALDATLASSQVDPAVMMSLDLSIPSVPDAATAEAGVERGQGAVQAQAQENEATVDPVSPIAKSDS